MWLANNWKEYEVIDCSEGEKLERWGKYTLLRPDPQVIWNTKKEDKHWKHLNAHYHRSKKGGGEWEFFDLPKQWDIHYRSLTFHLKPFTELICLYRWNNTCSRSRRSLCYTCRCIERNGYLGKRECRCFRSW